MRFLNFLLKFPRAMGRINRRSIVRLLWGLLFIASSLLASVGPQHPLIATTTDNSAQQLVQQGVEQYQSGNYQAAIAQWQKAIKTYQNLNANPQIAIVLENLARAYQHTGQPEAALQAWQESLDFHRLQGNRPKTGRLLTEQAQAYSQLGQHRQAIALLCGPQLEAPPCTPESALGIAQTEGDRVGIIAALGSLGNAYQQQGAYDLAIAQFKQALTLNQAAEQPIYQSQLLNSLGSVYVSQARLNYRRAQSFQALGYTRQADALQAAARSTDTLGETAFQDSLAIAAAPSLNRLQAQLNLIPIYYRTERLETGLQLRQQAQAQLQQLPDSRRKVFAALNLANRWQPETQIEQLFSQTACPTPENYPPIQTLLQGARATAERLGDRRAESFALGELGHLSECQQRYPEALRLTQQARWAAEDLASADSLYLWEWQTGRILKAQGQTEAAIAAYDRAIETLQQIRADIILADRNLRFDFRDTIEPIYRELAQLRLGSAPLLQAERQQRYIAQTLDTVDNLKLAELQNYFGDDCAITALPEASVEQISPNQTTAILSTLILGDRTAVILTLPNQVRQVHWLNVSQADLRQTVNQYRRDLESFFQPYDTQLSQQLYRWIVQPFEAKLTQNQIKTLVFVQDGILRSVPMAALHDGQQFLIQKYAIATTPFFRLSPAPALDRQNPKALVLGLSEAATVNDQQFSALSYVNQEVASLTALLPRLQSFLNQDFTRDRLQQALQSNTYPIIHIATHAEFGPEPKDTFLVTGNNEALSISEFDTLLRSANQSTGSVDLLTLTACRTAVGDDRAALGLAGVALQAGAKSTIASLWYINDRATAQFVEQFYQALLQPDNSKAEALQQAQIALLETGVQTSHPAYWAPFLLIGNWT